MYLICVKCNATTEIKKLKATTKENEECLLITTIQK